MPQGGRARIYGNDPRGGPLPGPLLQPRGGVWDTPYLQPLLASLFPTLARSALNFFGPFKSTQNPFWGTFELSNVKVFFGAPRQSGNKTLFMVIWGDGGSKIGIDTLWARSAEGKNFDNFGLKNMDFGSMGRRPGGGVFGPDRSGTPPLLPPTPRPSHRSLGVGVTGKGCG